MPPHRVVRNKGIIDATSKRSIQIDRRSRLCDRHVHGHHGHDDRERRHPLVGQRPAHVGVIDRVGCARLPRVPCGLDPGIGVGGDRIGTKRTFLFALFAFTVASALCGQAHSASELIAFRILQGVGGGMLTPVGTAMLFRAFPPAERAKASSVLMIPAVLAPALGPVVGGWLVTDVSWRWIFYVNLPVGLFGFIFGALFLKGAASRPPAASMQPASCSRVAALRWCCTRCRKDRAAVGDRPR